MNINVHVISSAVDNPACTFMEEIQVATSQDPDLQMLKSYIIWGWPHTKDEVEHSIQKYRPIRYKLAMIDGITMKGKCIIIPFILQNQIL